MPHYHFQELSEADHFDPSSLLPQTPFTQAKFYGDWQKKINRAVRRFFVIKNGKTVAYFQIIKFPLLLGKGYLYIPYGPLTTDHSNEFLSALKSKLIQVTKQENAVFTRLDFTPSIPNNSLKNFFTQAPTYTYHSAYFQPRNEWFLDLAPTEEELLKSMHEKTRYSIRLSHKKEIVTEIIDKDFINYFETFYALMLKTASRNNFSLHPRKYYENIFDTLETIPNSYLAIARHKETVLAIDLTITYGRVATYVFGASSSSERNRMPSFAVLWQAITHAKHLGCTHYNFGAISTEKDVHKGWSGLTTFKKRFGGAEALHSDFFDVVVNPFWYHMYNLRKRFKNKNS